MVVEINVSKDLVHHKIEEVYGSMMFENEWYFDAARLNLKSRTSFSNLKCQWAS